MRHPWTVSGVGREHEEVADVDERVHDEAVIAEIALTADVMIAASEHEGPLTQREVDTLLGLS